MEEIMYCFESKVRYSEVNSKGRITLNAILDYFQDCSFFHSEELKVGLNFLMEKQIAWVLSFWQIEVNRYPVYGEQIRICTWPYDFKGFIGYRNFTMKNEKEELLAYANSIWVLLDLQSKKPVRILPEMIQAYQMSPQLSMEYTSRKINLPEKMEVQEPFLIHKYHIDTNQHVNNGKYVSMAQEYLPCEFEIRRMRAEYQKAAVYGDMIYPYTGEKKEKNIVVNLADKQGKPYAIIELEGY